MCRAAQVQELLGGVDVEPEGRAEVAAELGPRRPGVQRLTFRKLARPGLRRVQCEIRLPLRLATKGPAMTCSGKDGMLVCETFRCSRDTR